MQLTRKTLMACLLLSLAACGKQEVQVAVENKDDNTALINISCRKGDIGRIVGKNGKTIAAIRSLVKGAALPVASVITLPVQRCLGA